MVKRHVIRYHVGSLTSGEERHLKNIRDFQNKCSNKDPVQIWYDVRNGSLKRFPRGFLEDDESCAEVVRAFVKEYKSHHSESYPKVYDFSDNKLSGLIHKKYEGSPYRAFVEAGFTEPDSDVFDPVLKEAPWSILDNMPHVFMKEYMRVKAVKWLVEKTGKIDRLQEITANDFKKNNIVVVLDRYNNGSPVGALIEAGFEISPADMKLKPTDYWADRFIRQKAIIEMVTKSGKTPDEIKLNDFEMAGLWTIINRDYYNGSPIKALQDAGFEVDTLKRKKSNRFWQDEKNVRVAVTEICKKTGKPLNDITYNDLRTNGCSGAVAIYDMNTIKKIATSASS